MWGGVADLISHAKFHANLYVDFWLPEGSKFGVFLCLSLWLTGMQQVWATTQPVIYIHPLVLTHTKSIIPCTHNCFKLTLHVLLFRVVLRNAWNWSHDNDTVSAFRYRNTRYYHDTRNVHCALQFECRSEFTSLRLSEVVLAEYSIH